jgi:hypothetical protein
MLRLIRFPCPKCGNGLRITTECKRAWCRKCRNRVRVTALLRAVTRNDPAPSAPLASTDAGAADASPTKKQRNPFLPAAVAGGIVGLVVVAALWWHLDDLHRAAREERIEAAVVANIEAARAFAAQRRWDEAVALLEEAAASDLEERAQEALNLLGQVHEARLVATAEAAIDRRDFRRAKKLLDDYLAQPKVTAKGQAQRLAADLALATSAARAVEVLRRLPDADLKRLAAGQPIPELERVAWVPLRAVYASVLRSHVVAEQETRTARARYRDFKGGLDALVKEETALAAEHEQVAMKSYRRLRFLFAEAADFAEEADPVALERQSAVARTAARPMLAKLQALRARVAARVREATAKDSPLEALWSAYYHHLDTRLQLWRHYHAVVAESGDPFGSDNEETERLLKASRAATRAFETELQAVRRPEWES